MSVDPDYIEQLVLDEIAGVITPEDSATLNNILAQEPEALVIRNDLYARYANHPALDMLPESLSTEKVWNSINKRRKSYALLRTALSIAASALIIIGAYLFFAQKQKIASPLVHVAAPEDNKNVMLHLPNGQQVNLSNTQPQIQVGNITLNNQQKQLSYTAAAENSMQQATLVVPPGKDYTIKLSDGSSIQLNAGTKLQFPFSFNGKTREITLNGEAYLDVAPDATKPFIVHLPHSTVIVLGTEFNVNTYDSGQINVALVKGAVKLHTTQDSILLHPGFAVRAQEGVAPHETPFDAEEVLSWRQGIYIFNNATIMDMSKVITRWFGINVVIDNPASAKHRFKGFIDRKQSIRPFLDGLKFTGQFDYYFDKDSVLHMQ